MRKIQHVLCPTDLSERSRRAFLQAVALARTCGARVTLL